MERISRTWATPTEREKGSCISFMLGYNNVKLGKVKAELTAGEIQAKWPKENPDSFANGMIDALNKDPFRYQLVKEQLNAYGLLGLSGAGHEGRC